MKTFKPRRCRACGTGTILPRAKRGRKTRYRTLMLELPAGFRVPTCSRCKAEWINDSVAEAMDKVLEKVFRRELRKLANTAITTITKSISQSRLESLIGVSQGYISKVKRGEREPSRELVSVLALLAKDPRERARELERFWGLDAEE